MEVDQYAHTAWKTREGFFKDGVVAIAQTPDGYLWLGTDFGLLRFDGVRNTPWQPPAGEQLPSSGITSLLATHDGTLWIGTNKGLAGWRDGKLTQQPELAGQVIVALLEDRDETLWAGALGTAIGRLCAIQSGSTRCYGDDGTLGAGVLSLYEDRGGKLWAGAGTGLWQWKPGPPKLYSMPRSNTDINALIEGDNGTLLIALSDGLRQLVDGKAGPYQILGKGRQPRPHRLLRDHDGGLWIGTTDQGLLHVHHERTDVFTKADGLSSDTILSLFEDREGNIWVATRGGLDRFSDLSVSTISVKQGLSSDFVWSVLAPTDGSVWLANPDGLNKWKDGTITLYSKHGAQAARGEANQEPGVNGVTVASAAIAEAAVRKIADSGLEGAVNSLTQDGQGRVWISTRYGVAYFDNGRFIPVSGVPEGRVYSIVGDSGGNLWISNPDRGLFHLRNTNMVERIPWAELGRKDYALTLQPDPLHGGLWLGFQDSGLAYFKDGQVRASFAVSDGLGGGRVNGLQLDEDGTLWAATDGGLSRLKNGRATTITDKNGLPCDTVHWMMEDDAHSFWLYMPCGLVRIIGPELEAWVTDPKRTIKVTVFDGSDGVRSQSHLGGYSPHVAKSADGKLWFVPDGGISVVDPRHIFFNKLPPPVHVEQVTADHKTQEASANVHLPPLVRELEIDYTALSFVAPEKVLFRYQLEGYDRDWQNVGARRQAFYTNLPPGNYRFRVTACNNSGVWNTQGASLDFSIAPAYWQTLWFRALCGAAFLGLLVLLYWLRVRQLAHQFNIKLDARIDERTRIARELHDTLLQNFQGVLLQFRAALRLLSKQPGKSEEVLSSAIDQAAEAIKVGREAVQGLRVSAQESNDLAAAIGRLGQDLAASQGGADVPAIRVVMEGAARNLHPIIRDEIFRVAGEALRNAMQHSHGSHVEVELWYDPREFRLRVRDDGQGIDQQILDAGGRQGHFGLRGMRERARLVGGKLTVWSAPGEGTEVELIIPGAKAYGALRRSRPREPS